MRGYVRPDDGYTGTVLRIALAVGLLVVVAAGCGGADRPQRSAVRGVPRALAQDWADQASAIAIAASAGQDCRALHLATSLREAVVLRRRKLPFRLRSPLLAGVNALAGRLTCTPVRKTPAPPHKPPPHKPPHPPPSHHPRDDHGHHRAGGDKGKGP
jgi:hypothetical protein